MVQKIIVLFYKTSLHAAIYVNLNSEKYLLAQLKINNQLRYLKLIRAFLRFQDLF